jgi:hypothetical protein
MEDDNDSYGEDEFEELLELDSFGGELLQFEEDVSPCRGLDAGAEDYLLSRPLFMPSPGPGDTLVREDASLESSLYSEDSSSLMDDSVADAGIVSAFLDRRTPFSLGTSVRLAQRTCSLSLSLSLTARDDPSVFSVATRSPSLCTLALVVVEASLPATQAGGDRVHSWLPCVGLCDCDGHLPAAGELYDWWLFRTLSNSRALGLSKC